MPYDNADNEELVRSRARKGLDADGNPIRNPPPPAPAASSPVRFGKPFSPEDKAKQSAAHIKFLRERGEY